MLPTIFITVIIIFLDCIYTNCVKIILCAMTAMDIIKSLFEQFYSIMLRIKRIYTVKIICKILYIS